MNQVIYLVGLVVVVILVSLAAWHARPHIGWMLLGVLSYLVIFNGKYLLIDHKTYSLSSLVDAPSFIGSTALTVLLSLLVGWIIMTIGVNMYRANSRKAADITMKFILVLLSIFSIPIAVHYVLNGALVSWTLPDFLTSFLGFSFLVQSMVVALLGIIFTGLAALLGVFARK